MQRECYWCGKSYELTQEQEKIVYENMLMSRQNGKTLMTFVNTAKMACCSNECAEKFLAEAVKNTDWGRKRWSFAVPMKKE